MAQDLSQAISQSWTLPPGPTIAVLIAAVVYVRGWRLARVTRPRELPPWRALSFLSGLAILWLVLASPLDALGQFLLLAHMTQHWALMSVVPPLLLLGAPVVPLLRGLPKAFVRDDVSPWLNAGPVRALGRFLSHPAFGWLAMNIAFLGWHVPAAYELALRSNGWHDVEHACFLFTSIAFWWFVIRPWPSHNRRSRWLILPYLVSADFVNTGLSAFLTFCGRVVYPTYGAVPRIYDISAMSDQSAAGAEMWVLGSLPFLLPAAGITLQLIASDHRRRRTGATVTPAAARASESARFDLLRVPLVGSLLRARHGRAALQALSLAAMTLILLHGLTGTPASVFNLAGASLWNVLRPLNLALLLLCGNLFCMACPFTLPRELAKRLGLGRVAWPRWMRSKWPAIVLLIAFFWAYEALSLWDSPRGTAGLLLAYVVTAFVVDSVFRDAGFCKYVCPIGQFNFVASLVAPLELGVRSMDTCTSCASRDCIRGNAQQRGCELKLYLPTKVGNMDCTLCMDCVKACPHDNVAITLQQPARDLVRDPVRSSLRRFSTRIDVAVLFLVVTCAALLNAAFMTGPVAEWLAAAEEQFPQLAAPDVSLALTFVLAATLALAPLALAWALRALAGEAKTRAMFCRVAVALLPLGLAMWTAHLSFHLVSTAPSVPVIAQHVAGDLSGTQLGARLMPAMPQVCRPMDVMLMPGAKGFDLLGVQLLLLDLGLLLTLYAGWRMIRERAASRGRTAAMLSLWVLAAGGFYALCAWLFTLPMEMRGMGM